MTDKYKEKIDEVRDAPASSIGSSYTFQDDIKSMRLESISTADDTVTITEPSSPAHSQYPYNKVEESLSGHIREIDDTPGAERIMEMHKSGTFYEIHPDGTRVLRIYGDNFEIALSDNNLVVGGNLNITVQGDANILTKGNVKQKIGGDYDLNVHGNMTTRVEGKRVDYTKSSHDIQTASNLSVRNEGNFDHYSKGRYSVSTSSTFNAKSSSTMNLQSSSVVYVDGSQVQLNKPGPGASVSVPTLKDPTGGLTVADSVIEPNADTMKVMKMNNASLAPIVNDKDLKYPKDRRPLKET